MKKRPFEALHTEPRPRVSSPTGLSFGWFNSDSEGRRQAGRGTVISLSLSLFFQRTHKHTRCHQTREGEERWTLADDFDEDDSSLNGATNASAPAPRPPTHMMELDDAAAAAAATSPDLAGSGKKRNM